MGNTSKLTKIEAEALERDTKAINLRIAGASYSQIDAQLKYCGYANARRAVERRMTKLRKECSEKAQELREQARQRMDALLLVAWPKRQQPTWWDRALKAVESIRRLEGLDAAAKHEHSGQGGGPITLDFASMTREQIQRIAAGDFGALPASAAAGEGVSGAAEADGAGGEDSGEDPAD